MSQVTIYLEEDALTAAKLAAARTQISVSKWFAQFAEAEKQKPKQSWGEFFEEIDRLGEDAPDATDGWDALLKDRHTGIGTDTPRESF